MKQLMYILIAIFSFALIFQSCEQNNLITNNSTDISSQSKYLSKSGDGYGITIDIKPDSDTNPINCEKNDKSKAVITVAILTTLDFDALTIDHTTVRFGVNGTEAAESHVKKKTGEVQRHEEDVDGDGDVDLVFHFLQSETGLLCETSELCLTGETHDGLPIQGCDAIDTGYEPACTNPLAIFQIVVEDDEINYSARSGMQTSDGGYIICGSTTEYGNQDALIVKFNACGEEEWRQIYGGPGFDGANSIKQTSDDGYIYTGYYGNDGNGSGVGWLVKLDALGNILWENYLGNTFWEYGGLNVILTSDNGFLVSGNGGPNTGSIAFVSKTDGLGNIEWSYTPEPINISFIEESVESSDGNYYLCGWKVGAGTLFSSVSNSGSVNWSKNGWYPYNSPSDQVFWTLQQTVDGGILLAGSNRSWFNDSGGLMLVKTSTDGDVEWKREHDLGGYFEPKSMKLTSDNGYIVVGTLDGIAVGIKLNNLGDVEWQISFDTEFQVATEVTITSDGGYLITGLTVYNDVGKAWIIKTDESGNYQ